MYRASYFVRLALLVFLFAICSAISLAQDQNHQNVLLIIADDLGLDPMPNYYTDYAMTKANMPNIEALMEQGVTFDNVWSNSLCAPTRATILTGLYGFRTNVLSTQTSSVISTDEYTLHTHLTNGSNGNIASSIIGKWHLSGGGVRGPVNAPGLMGIDYYTGFYGGAMSDYYNWELIENEQRTTSTTYVTAELTDLAIDWINEQDTAWFAWVAYTSPHSPFHLPPEGTYSQTGLSGTEADIEANPLPYYIAMIENLDYEVGRLLEGIPADELANTTIIFVGDNGTERQVVQAPYTARQAKGTVQEGGIHVPMVIAGTSVTRSNERDDALINLADLFPTISELFGIAPPSNIDGQSFAPLLTDASAPTRDWIYSEILMENSTMGNGQQQNRPNTQQRPGRNNNQNNTNQTTEESSLIIAIRNQTYKLITSDTGETTLYNLLVDPFETNNLNDGNLTAEEQTAMQELQGIITQLHASS